MNKLILFAVILLTQNVFAAERPCTDAKMKAAKSIDVRSDATMTSSSVSADFTSDFSSVSFNFGDLSNATTTAYFRFTDGSTCPVLAKGVVLTFIIPQTFPASAEGTLGMTLLNSCATKLSKNKSNPSMNGATVFAANGKTMNDIGVSYNASTGILKVTGTMGAAALGGFSCAQ